MRKKMETPSRKSPRPFGSTDLALSSSITGDARLMNLHSQAQRETKYLPLRQRRVGILKAVSPFSKQLHTSGLAELAPIPAFRLPTLSSFRL